MNLMYNYVDLYSDLFQATGETLSGLTGLEWSCDVRQARV